MKNLLQQKPIHTFLIGLYIVFFIYVNNIKEVTVAMTLRSIVATLLVTFLLFGITYMFFRSLRKAGIFTTLLLLGFFSYGIIYDHLEDLYYQGMWPLSHIHRFLILAYILVYLFLFIRLYVSKQPYYKANYFFNVFILILFFLNAFSGFLSFEKSGSTDQAKNPFLPASQKSLPIHRGTLAAPDVYYIVLDGYAAESILKQFYSDKSRLLYDYLRRKQFYIADSSHSNYSSTAPSLASSLNIDYLDTLKSQRNEYELIRQNLVTYIFKTNNYRVISIKSGYAITESLAFADKFIKIEGFNEFERRLMELTVLRLDKVLGFSRYKQVHSQLEELKQFTKEAGPKFCFVHIVAPHPPYVVDSEGKRKVRTSLSDMAWEPKADYEGQLEYVSKKIMLFIDQILANSKTPPLIVLQSDHGPWMDDANPQNVYEARTRILNAYFVPETYRAFLYPQITPVNSFRLISSQLFNLNYPLLPDRPVPFSEIADEITFKKYAD